MTAFSGVTTAVNIMSRLGLFFRIAPYGVPDADAGTIEDHSLQVIT